MEKIFYDFHIHSCLSPCGDEDSTVNNVVRMAKIKGLNAIAIADHNSTGNCKSALEVGKREGITVLPAMELTTEEEIHILMLFSSLAGAEAFGSLVKERMMKIKSDPKIFGRQVYLGSEDEEIGEEEYLLTVSSGIGVYETADLAKKYGGVAIPAHIDKQANGLLGILGVYDEQLKFTAVECKEKPPLNLPFITNSDAHYIWDISEAENYILAGECSAESIVSLLSSGNFKAGSVKKD